METLRPTQVYTDKIIKLSRYIVEHERDANNKFIELKTEFGRIYLKGNVKEIQEYFFAIKMDWLCVVDIGVGQGSYNSISVLNSNDVKIGDMFTILNHWLNGAHSYVISFNFEDKDLFGRAWNDDVTNGKIEYQKYVIEIVSPNDISTNPIPNLTHYRPDVIKFERSN